jgi:hypothetical protein
MRSRSFLFVNIIGAEDVDGSADIFADSDSVEYAFVKWRCLVLFQA